MGVSAHPLVVSPKEMVQGNEEKRQESNGRSCLPRKFTKVHARRRHQTRITQEVSKKHINYVRSKKPRRVLMRRKLARLDDSRRLANGVQVRVRTLKKLIPNCESVGLDRLFRETADYILSLQMRVKAMQIVVDALAGTEE